MVTQTRVIATMAMSHFFYERIATAICPTACFPQT